MEVRPTNKGFQRGPDNNGFSLIEALVAIAIMSIIALGTATLLSQAGENVAYLEDKLSHLDLKEQFKLTLKDKGGCSQTVAGKSSSILRQPVRVFSGDGKIAWDANDDEANTYERLMIDSIDLVLEEPIPSNTADLVHIEVSASRERTGGGPKGFKAFRVPLRVVTDGSSNIESCEVIGGLIHLAEQPERILKFHNGPSGTRITSHFDVTETMTITQMKVPANATHAIVRFLTDMNTLSGNIGLATYLGGSPSRMSLVNSLDTDDARSMEANSSGFSYVPIDPDDRSITWRVRSAGSADVDIQVNVSLYLDGFIVTTGEFQ